MSWKKKVVVAGVFAVAVVGAKESGQQTTANAAATGIPADYQALYEAAASTCANLDAALLAGVGSVETDHGRSTLPGVSSGSNPAGAMGPMQFLGATWAGVRDQHPEVGPNVYDPAHAIPAAAHLLCDTGVRRGDVEGALWMYNHDDAYVADVLERADAYRREGAL